MSGVQQPTISGIERGDTKYPAHESLRRLSDVLGVSIEELVGVRPPEEVLPPEEREEMCARFDTLEIDEQRALLRLVRRLTSMPPDRGQLPQGDEPQGPQESGT
jgi:transcriptional regulator with XRE-family HTH domain